MANPKIDQVKVTDKQVDLGDVATELIKARTRAGLSQSQLAERSGLSRNAVMGYESGRNKPGAREMRLLCEALKVTPNQLLFGSEEPFKETDTVFTALGLTSENQEAALFSVMFNMLGRDERRAVVTLVHNLLEARHGEKFKEVIDVMGVLSTELEQGEVGQLLGSAFSQKEVERVAKGLQEKAKAKKS